ncbi:hypothetical protein ACQ4PT_007510 [Festuca glaucescens]
MPPEPQRDAEMAEKYDISLEVLREGLPLPLQSAPDGQIIFGDPLRVRVATAQQLQEAVDLILETAASFGDTPPRPPSATDCYVVPYSPPREALQLRQLLDGAPYITVQNMAVLEAKEEALAQITRRIAAVEELIGMLRNLAARLLLRHQNPAGNAKQRLFALKIRLGRRCCNQVPVTPLISFVGVNPQPQHAGDIDTAKSLLTDVPGIIEGNAAEFGQERILEVAGDLSELYLEDLDLVEEDEVSDKICRLILAEVSSSHWRDKMQLIDDDPRLLEFIEDTIAELQRRVTLYEEITTEPSLIGASHVDFDEL